MTASKNPAITQILAHFSKVLKEHPAQAATDRLQAAIRHSLWAPSKHIRAMLCYATGLSFGADLPTLDRPALAIEAIHTYSLIHDDLPAMDNANQRRGQASCHIAFDEAHAILAGDALLTWAFELISSARALDPQQRCDMMTQLSQASGPMGMVGGQSLDLINDPKQLKRCHQLKTGALIKTALRCGCIGANQSWGPEWEQLTDHLGLAYQLQDDLLDLTASSDALGKPAQLDTKNAKQTLPQTHGLAAAQEQLAKHTQGMQTLLLEMALDASPLAHVIQLAIPNQITTMPCHDLTSH